MWCPKCRNEYINGVTTCVDCGCDLVEELPEEMNRLPSALSPKKKQLLNLSVT